MKLTLGKETNPPASPEKKKPKEDEIPQFAKSPRGFLIELVKIVIIAVVVIVPVRYFLFQPFYVRGASMEPNFYDNEYLIVDEITYRFTDPQRGEVVVVKDPKQSSEFLIKRIIGLPGETVEVSNGHVIVYNDQSPEGVTLVEDYLFDDIRTNGGKKTTLSIDEYYLMGDNRPVSLDSRNFGTLLKENIVGRAWLRVWPFEDFTHFEAPAYNALTP